MSVTDERIKEYKEAFFNVHGRYPIIDKRGAWLKIDDSWTSFRSSQLPLMTNILIDRYRKKVAMDEMVTLQRQRIMEIKEPEERIYWKGHIRQDSIEMFLEKLYQKCDNSVFQMQRWLDDFGLGDMPITNIEKINDLENTISRLKNRERELESDYENSMNSMMKEIKRLRKRIVHLKKNSVIFSMDDNGIDFDAPDPPKKDEYNIIPF